jgi:putative DNA primase/helicase
LLATNHRPRIVGTDVAIWRRVRLLPFTVTIEKPDKEFPAKLEAEAPGILRWAVEGCLQWLAEGLEPPSAVEEASKSYKRDSDRLADFIDERCETRGIFRATRAELYKAYTDWAESQGLSDREKLSDKAFGESLNERGFKSGRNHYGRFYEGLRVQSGAERDA